MIIVSDTSPITSLLSIDQIELLPQLYTTIFIPKGVEEELLKVQSRKSELETHLSKDWLEVRELTDQERFEEIFTQLDKGESEAIALALELNADLILIDESKGRKIARSYGLEVTGLLGVLIEAKSKKLVPSVKALLDELISKAGFYLKRDLYLLVLEAVGEKSD